MENNYRFVGERLPRRDARDIVTGKTKFYDDVVVPGALSAKVLRSPYAHARIVNIDTSAAEDLPGVRAVLTHKETPAFHIPPPVFNDTVRFVGDAVALLAADTEAIAEAALELIEVEYDVLPAVFDPEDALAPDAPQVRDDCPGNLFRVDVPLFASTSLHELIMGDVDEGFAEADFVVEGACSYHGLPNPLPIAPPGVTAAWDGPNRLTFWAPSQGVFNARSLMQEPLGKDVDIRVIATNCGGSFGTKHFYDLPYFGTAALAKATGKPVKMYYTKREHLGAFVVRPGSKFAGKIGIKKDGTITAISGELMFSAGADTQIIGQMHVGFGEAQLPIRCKNWNVKPKPVVTNRIPSGVVRGFGGQELKSSLLPVLSMALEKIEMDPLEFFKKNYVKAGDGFFWRDGKWYTCRGLDYTKAMEKGAEAFGWKEKWKGWLKPTAVNGTLYMGVGVGVHGNADSGEDPSEAYARLNPNGTVMLHVSISETGMGQRSSLCKMAAEVLNVPFEKILITDNDTDINPFDFGLGGSRGTYAIGSAVIAACEDALSKLLAAGAKELNTNLENVETVDGQIFRKDDPNTTIPWYQAIDVTGGVFATGSIVGTGRYEPDYTVPNFMMTFVEVAVDTETGVATLLRVLHTSDVGQIIDPQALAAQFHGSLGSAGIDSALFEESVLDPNDGRVLNVNMIDYKWRSFLELPKMDNVILEGQLPTHRFKALGIGEITTAPGPSAVLMAVSNALGIRFNSYPLTPDKILSALSEIKEK